MAATDTERFWDERAREDALHFVDDRMQYGAADEERFWAGGAEVGCCLAGRPFGRTGAALGAWEKAEEMDAVHRHRMRTRSFIEDPVMTNDG